MANPDVLSQNVEPPKDLSRSELIEFVRSKAEIPITSVEITPHVLRNLTRTQLISYLTERGYVPLGKSKLTPLSSDLLAAELEVKVLEFAIKDFEENLANDYKNDYNYIIPKVLQDDESIELQVYSRGVPLTYDMLGVLYREDDLNYILKKFCSNRDAIFAMAAQDKVEFVNKSLQLLAAGSL